MTKRAFSLFLYQLLMLLLLPIILVVLIVRSFSQSTYRNRLLERLGLLPSHISRSQIVIHGASVGEIIALKPFIEKLLADPKGYSITLTCFTPTGSSQIQKLFGKRVQHCYLPLDNPLSVALFYQKIKPKAVVIMETELWPSLIHGAKSRDIKLLLVNGRLSQKSVNHYQKLSWLVKPTLACFDLITTQSENNRENFNLIGAPTNKVKTLGNLKYDIVLSNDVLQKVENLKQHQISEKCYWVVGSSHPADESLIINAYNKLIENFPQLVLVLVPRHPERFDKVAQQLNAHGLNTVRRSSGDFIQTNTQVWLVDTLGELLAFYALADVCTVAGSFSDIGGHNPLEPALFAKPIVVGPDMANFADMTSKLESANAIVKLTQNEDLYDKVLLLLTKPNVAQELGKSAHAVVLENQGATANTITHLKQLID